MLASLWFFNDSFNNIVTITFSALILIELANVYSSITHLTLIMFFAMIVTIASYFGSIIFLK
jgi:phospholipid-translocating ATPase